MRKLDMAWINGNIYTADDKFSTAAAFGVSGDRFSVVGSTEEVLENCDEHTKIIDLQGKTVLPGLIDAHLHITNTGAMKLNLNLVSKQKQEILDMVADAYSSAKKENGSLDGDGSMIRGMIHHFLPKKTWMLWRRIHRYTLQEPADMLHGRIQRHLKQQGSQRIHQTRQGENFYVSRMEASLVWLLIRRRIHLIKQYHRIQRNRSRRSYCWPSRNSFQMV